MELAQFLDGLKLNKYEKEVILYLSNVNSADAGTIYKNTKVPQGRIYSVLQSLKIDGFVDVIPTSPKKFRIKNLKYSLKKYLESKKNDLENQMNKVESIEEGKKSFNLDKNDPSVHIFTGRDEHINALISLRDNVKSEFLQIAPWFIGTYASNLSLHKSLKRGVNVKIIIKEITDKNRKNVKEAIAHGAEIKRFDSKDLLSLAIIDSKEFLLGVQNYDNQEERLTLLSQNKALCSSLENTFYGFWKKAKPISIKK